MIPNSAPIIQLLRPATDHAVMRAVHDTGPLAWHKRWGVNPVACEFCPSELSEKIEADRQRILDEQLDEMLPPGTVIAPWQRKLATEVLAAKAEEMDAVVEEAVISPALAAYLDEHELVPDSKPEIIIDEVSDWVVVPRSKDDQAQDEQFVLVDSVAVGSYSEMTAKALRPLASAAGMKGARVASKADMIAFLSA